MTTLKLMNGDCIEKMKEMADESVEAILCDPPYGLKFMNKDFDDLGEGAQQREWHIQWLREAYRILKPNGVIKAFGGTRTYQHLLGAMEDVGFVDLGLDAWCYGCLSEDTEILTSDGWVEHSKLNNGSMVVSYCIDNDTYQVQAVEEVVRYEYKDTAYRIQSDNTDQIVSRNHRCIVEREGKRTFLFAEHLQANEVVPFVAQLPTMSESLYLQEENGKVLFESLSLSSNTDNRVQGVSQGVPNQESQSRLLHQDLLHRTQDCSESSIDLPRLSEAVRETSCVGQEIPSFGVFTTVQWSSEGRRMESTRPQGTSELDTRKRTSLSGENDRKYQPSVERWSDLSQSQGELHNAENRLCEMPNRVYLNGEKRWVCDGTSFESSTSNWQTTDENRMCSSYQPQRRGQSVGELDVVQDQSGSQTVRSTWETRTTLATITPIEYEGIVWCVKVPTGAFVARRNGKIFVTGNSGFPKSLNIAKSFDARHKKETGEEGEIIGHKKGVGGENMNDIVAGREVRDNTDEGGKGVGAYGTGAKQVAVDVPIRELVTEEAKTWEGWGTALKPAWEPVCVGYKK